VCLTFEKKEFFAELSKKEFKDVKAHQFLGADSKISGEQS
jgi:hypothetical protein